MGAMAAPVPEQVAASQRNLLVPPSFSSRSTGASRGLPTPIGQPARSKLGASRLTGSGVSPLAFS
eukprot:1790391-Alexandrium_andersonii.AAC.1